LEQWSLVTGQSSFILHASAGWIRIENDIRSLEMLISNSVTLKWRSAWESKDLSGWTAKIRTFRRIQFNVSG
jgi:hypothetical protein